MRFAPYDLAESLDQLADSYEEWLQRLYPDRVEAYRTRRSADRGGATFEAVAISLLRQVHREKAAPAEDLGSGGPDFECRETGEVEPFFVVEATCLNVDAVSRRSGVPSEEWTGGQIDDLTEAFQLALKEKARQVSNQPCPTAVMIGVMHPRAHLLVSTQAAEYLLTGDQKLWIARDESAPPFTTSELREAAFFKAGVRGNRPSRLVRLWRTILDGLRRGQTLTSAEEDRVVIPLRRSISAAVLVFLGGMEVEVVGLIHPDPVHPFSPTLLPGIPFVRIAKWPPEDGTLSLEWLVCSPRPASVPLFRVTPTREELRAIGDSAGTVRMLTEMSDEYIQSMVRHRTDTTGVILRFSNTEHRDIFIKGMGDRYNGYGIQLRVLDPLLVRVAHSGVRSPNVMDARREEDARIEAWKEIISLGREDPGLQTPMLPAVSAID